MSAELTQVLDGLEGLKKHGQQTCKHSQPKCEVCPLTEQCAYLQAKAADANTETE